ncbi:cell surface protein [uncultured Clostridium sp.]|uniref:cell surface protein n=1 Tax=uncultured Clostridium sp. TaxID=59620 RepID=UPI0026DB1FA6|nr:cell surface protein [uncultured Clostridium sp.]
MKDRNLWMKKEEKRTAPGLKRAPKAVLGHKIVRLAGIAGVSLLFSASAAQTVLADDAGVWQPVENGYYLVGMDGSYLTGWQQMGGKWYLLGADGLMKTGWEQEKGTWYYLQGDGAMATGWQNIDGKYYFLKDSGAMEGTIFTKDETQYTINADGSLANAKKKKNTGGGAYTLAFLDADTQAMADSLNELKADAFDGDEEEDYYDDDKKDYDKDASFILNGKLQQIAEHRLAMARSKGYGSSRIPDEGTLDDYLKSIGESTARRHTEIYLINCDDVTQAEEKLLRNHDSDEKKRVDRVIYYKEMGVAHQQVGDKHYYMIILMR